MRYLFSSTYTPDDLASDRRRQRCVVEDANSVGHAIRLSLSNFGLNSIRDETIEEFPVHGSDAKAIGWPVVANNGTYYFEIEEFVASDPVTADAVMAWAQENDEPEEVLVNLLGRAYWRMIDQYSSFDLKQTLHDLMMEGENHRSYRSMQTDELVYCVMEEIVEGSRDNYDECTNGRPFGFAAMIDDDRELWLGGELPADADLSQ